MLPGQNWYGQILILIAMAAMGKSTKMLPLTTLVGYDRACNSQEEEKACCIVPKLVECSFDDDADSQYSSSGSNDD